MKKRSEKLTDKQKLELDQEALALLESNWKAAEAELEAAQKRIAELEEDVKREQQTHAILYAISLEKMYMLNAVCHALDIEQELSETRRQRLNAHIISYAFQSVIIEDLRKPWYKKVWHRLRGKDK